MSVCTEIDPERRRKVWDGLFALRDARPEHVHGHDQVGAASSPGVDFPLLDGVRDRDADHSGRALSASFRTDPAQGGLAYVVDPLGEVTQLLVCPAREHALLNPPLLPARDDVVDARCADDAERAVPGLPE